MLRRGSERASRGFDAGAGICPGGLFLWMMTMPPRIELPPEVLAEGKYLYEETLTPFS
jgi:hypothetical protein